MPSMRFLIAGGTENNERKGASYTSVYKDALLYGSIKYMNKAFSAALIGTRRINGTSKCME